MDRGPGTSVYANLMFGILLSLPALLQELRWRARDPL